jgi:hypothetical protein
MIHETASIVIACPVDEVYHFMSDPSNRLRYDAGLIAVRVTPDGPLCIAMASAQGIGELLRSDLGLFQNASQRADSKLPVQGHDAADIAVGCATPQNNVAAALPDSHKADSLQRPDRLFAGDTRQLRHRPPRRMS